jgi:hypothetical protein
MAYAFEQKILNASQSKQAGLLTAAKTAAVKPDTGVTVNKRSAYFVIRDCAKITEKYLVHYIWGDIKNPIDRLEGVFTKAEIEDFLSRARRDVETQHLCTIILEDIHKKNKLERPQIGVQPAEPAVVKIDFTELENDKIYGDYDTGGSADVVDIPLEVLPEKEKSVLELFLEAFKPRS